MSVINNFVLLLKSEKSDNGNDKYQTLLTSKNFDVSCVKTLDFKYETGQLYNELIINDDKYSGLILSSPRCVTAIEKSISKDLIQMKWGSKCNFVVGEATYKDALDKLGLKCDGKETGNGRNLSKLIVKNKSNYDKPFLMPHGNLRTDTIETELAKENVEVKGCLVYETIANPNIENELLEATQNYWKIPHFIVFFSPSGFRSSIDFLIKSPAIDLNQIKFIAIGPTTELAITESGYKVFATAERPTPDELLKCLIN